MIALACFNFSTSSFMASKCYLADLLGFCLLGGNRVSRFNLWVMKVGSTPGTLYGVHAKMSKFFTNDDNISTWSSGHWLFPIWKYLSSYGKILIWTNSSALSTPTSSSSSCNCYNDSGSTCSFYLILWLIAATRHCRATCWSPLTTTIPSLVENLTFMCSVSLPWHESKVDQGLSCMVKKY